MSIVNDRIKERRIASGKTLLQVAEYLGVKEATAQRYESGTIKTIKYETIVSLSEFFNCDPSYLMGWVDSPTRSGSNIPVNFEPLPKMKEWPVIGSTACGSPLHRETFDEYVTAPVDIRADVVFRCVGDSMINARIFDGDVVFVRLQPQVESGQIAVVRIEDEYTLKRVYLGEDYVELRAENPTHRPIILRGDDLNPDNFEIVGLAVFFLSPVQ